MGRIALSYNDDLETIIKNYIGHKVNETSIKAYINSLRNIFKILGVEPSVECLLDFKNVKDSLINKGYQLTTIKNKMSSIITYLRANNANDSIIQNYTDFIDSLSGKIDRQLKTMDKNPKEKENWLSKYELLELKNKMKSRLPKTINNFSNLLKWQQYISLDIHLKYPLRNDLCDAMICLKTHFKTVQIEFPNLNYIVLDNKNKKCQIILEAYKTVKTFKTIVIDVDEDICKDIFKYNKELKDYKRKNEISNTWFLIDKNGDKISRNGYTQFFQNIFRETGKKIGTSLIRKIIISDAYNAPEIQRLGEFIGHDLGTELKYYVKA